MSLFADEMKGNPAKSNSGKNLLGSLLPGDVAVTPNGAAAV